MEKLQSILKNAHEQWASAKGTSGVTLTDEEKRYLCDNFAYNQYNYRAMGSELYLKSAVTATSGRNIGIGGSYTNWDVTSEDAVVKESPYLVERLVELSGMSDAYSLVA